MRNCLARFTPIFLSFLLLAGLSGSTLAAAPSFRFNHIHPFFFDRGKQDSLEMENVSDSDMLIRISVPSGSMFSFNEPFGGSVASFGIKAHSKRFVHIIYSPSTGYVETALATAQDQLSKFSDTITLMGRDSAYIRKPDYTVLKPTNRFTYLDQHKDIELTIQNITTDTIHVTSNFYPYTYHFEFGREGNNWAIPPLASQHITIRHYADTYVGDTTVFRFQGSRVGCVNDTLLLIATPAPGMDMDVDFTPNYQFLGTVPPDSTVCEEVLLRNNADYPVHLDWWYDSTERQFVPDFPTLPMLLHSRATIPIHFCLKAPSVFGQSLNQLVSFRYIDTNGHNEAPANLNGVVYATNCIQSNTDSVLFANVMVGDSIDRVLTLHNLTAHDYAISFLLLSIFNNDPSIYLVDTSTPLNIPAHGTANLRLRYKPSSGFASYTSGSLSGILSPTTSECSFWNAGVRGSSVTSKDPTVTDLFPSKKKTLVIASAMKTQLTRYYFRNNQSSDISVESIALASGRYYQIRAIEHQALPFVLKPGAYFSVEFAVISDSNGLYLDTLIVGTKNGLTDNYFPLQTIRTGGVDGSASVSSPVTQEQYEFSIFPNPASSILHFQFPEAVHTDIEILDILGHVVVSGQGTSSWTWDNKNADGATLAAGNYIVRAIVYQEGKTPITVSRAIRFE